MDPDPGEPSSPSIRWRAAFRQAAFALLLIGGFFGGLEIVLALAGVRPMLTSEDPLVGFAGNIPLFVEEQRADGEVVLRTARNKLDLFNEQEFPKNKGAGSYRIFCMGGSTTFGRPYRDNVSFCGWLRAFLTAVSPDRQWEIINAGGVSYASYRVARLMEELAQYQPDLFIIYSAQNEFLEERSYGSLTELPDWVLRTNAVLSGTRIYTVMSDVIEKLRTGTAQESSGVDTLPGEVNDILTHTAGPTTYSRDDRLKQQILRHYRLNLERMVRIGRNAGAEVLFVGPASNLKDMSPFKSEHRDGISDADRQAWAEWFRQGMVHQQAGRFAEALDAYRRAAAIDDRHADIHYRIGQALFSLSRYDDAEQAFWHAIDEDIAPLRQLSVMSDIIREVASGADVPMVDFRQVLRTVYLPEYGHAVFGNEYFVDHVHTTVEGYRLLGLELLDALIRHGIVAPEVVADKQTIARVTDDVMAQLDIRAHGEALLNLGKVFDWAGKFDEARALAFRQLELLGPNASGYRLLGNNAVHRGSDAEAIDYYLQAVAINPDLLPVRRALAEALSRQGKTADALEQYLEVVRINADDYHARDRAGVLLARQGKVEAAARQFKRALHSRPDFEPAAIDLMILLSRQRDYDEALRYGYDMLRHQPDSYRLHNTLGAVLAGQGNIDRAIEHFAEAVRLNPDFADARNNLRSARQMRDQAGVSGPAR